MHTLKTKNSISLILLKKDLKLLKDKERLNEVKRDLRKLMDGVLDEER